MSRESEREKLSDRMALWLAKGGVIETLDPGAASSHKVRFNPHDNAEPWEASSLPAIATVDE